MNKNADIRGLYSHFKALNEQIDKAYDRIKNEKEWDHSYSSEEDDFFKRSLRKGDITSYYYMYNSGKKSFNDLKGELNTNLILTDLPKPVKNYDFALSDVIAIMNIIKIESSKAMGILEKAIYPISNTEINRLESLHNDLLKFYSKIEGDYEKNIEKAIDEYRCGHILASVLISSRVIIYALDDIEKYIEKKEGKLDRNNKTEKIIEFIVKNKLIEKQRETNRYLIRVSKLARDRFSHNIKSYPDAGDPLSLLDGCLKFVEILSKLKKT